MNRKSLKDISWDVPEDVYRRDSALSYSTLSRYEREGFNNLDKLFEPIESPSLTFGSLVDTLITETPKEFEEKFFVAGISLLSDSLTKITKQLHLTYKDLYPSIKDIPDDKLLSAIEDIQWNNHWLPKTRINKIREECVEYYNLLQLCGGRVIVDHDTYLDAMNVVEKLESTVASRFYFTPDDAFDDNIERLYQLKFKANLDGIDYRCMADELIVIHDKKLIVPVDLKTSSKPSWDFYKSFLEWRYDIQARLYWQIIRANLDKDPYYKDFELADCRFIVVDRKKRFPLVWIFEHTKSLGAISFKDGSILRHPFDIGKELQYYLTNNPMAPLGIKIDKPNKIEDWIE